ncbi:hypothetical protein OGAPHI_005917 [Ogataea philodendri]|uniref:Uncharacterized protein n=1 Tax=Ogataea philodendri TaxID=1378263 RepID=A0A9P8NZ66_9ASCO|nr:uncharacterized protein OGAPHI_005917 [Ogataea philodendri]KAH3661739.1 hypothetical protein OGAPHI_005917 [Ogataea philodendri]
MNVSKDREPIGAPNTNSTTKIGNAATAVRNAEITRYISSPPLGNANREIFLRLVTFLTRMDPCTNCKAANEIREDNNPSKTCELM